MNFLSLHAITILTLFETDGLKVGLSANQHARNQMAQAIPRKRQTTTASEPKKRAITEIHEIWLTFLRLNAFKAQHKSYEAKKREYIDDTAALSFNYGLTGILK